MPFWATKCLVRAFGSVCMASIQWCLPQQKMTPPHTLRIWQFSKMPPPTKSTPRLTNGTGQATSRVPAGTRPSQVESGVPDTGESWLGANGPWQGRCMGESRSGTGSVLKSSLVQFFWHLGLGPRPQPVHWIYKSLKNWTGPIRTGPHRFFAVLDQLRPDTSLNQSKTGFSTQKC